MCTLIQSKCITVNGLSVSFFFSEDEYEYAPFDGWYNNYANPGWGAAGKSHVRSGVRDSG